MQGALGAAFLSLLGVGCLSYYALDSTNGVRREVQQTNEGSPRRLQSLSWAIDRGRPTWVSVDWRRRIHSASHRRQTRNKILKKLTADDAHQQQRLASLVTLRMPSADATSAPAGQVNAIRVSADMVRAERQSLAEGRGSGKRTLWLAKSELVFGGLLGAIFVATAGAMARRYYTAASLAGSGYLRAKSTSTSWSRVCRTTRYLHVGSAGQGS